MSPASRSKGTSAQSLAMLELLGTPEVKGKEVTDTPVIPISDDQRVMFKTVASCMAQGMSPVKIANFIERTEEEARQLFRHPLVIEQLKELAVGEDAEKALVNILAGAKLDSVFTLITLRDGAKSETVQYNSATKLIDLATKNPEEPTDNLPTDPKARAEELKRRLNDLNIPSNVQGS